VTRCRESTRLMLSWYATATVLRSEPGDLQRMLDDRAKPAYQRALAEYRQHIQNCVECRKLRAQ